MQKLGSIKTGDTFGFTVTLADETTGEELTGIADKLRCQGRHFMTNELLTELIISEISPGKYFFSAPSTNWEPCIKILFDVEYSSGGVTSSTETFYVDVIGDITHD